RVGSVRCEANGRPGGVRDGLAVTGSVANPPFLSSVPRMRRAGNSKGVLLVFVLTENGELVNLALAERVAVTRPATSDDTYRVVVMFHQNAPNTCIALCSCDDEEHGKRIVRELFDFIFDLNTNPDLGSVIEMGPLAEKARGAVVSR